MMNKTLDYYSILEIKENATSDEIKKAYKKLALIYHPDKNIDNKKQAEEKFKLITEARDVLEDQNKRTQYDFERKGIINHGNSFSNFEFIKHKSKNQNNDFNNFHHNKTDSFEDYVNKQNKLKYTIKKKIVISLRDFYLNNPIKVSYQRRLFNNGVEIPEYKQFYINNCYKLLNKKENNISNKGNQIPDNKNYFGDLLLLIEEKSHPEFRRNNYDLYYTHKINHKEFKNKDKFEFLHIDNTTISYKLPNNFNINKPLLIKNKGMIKDINEDNINRANLYIYIELI